MTKICLYAICGDNERDEDLDRWFEVAAEADGSVVLFTGTEEGMFDKLSAYAAHTKESHVWWANHGSVDIPRFRFDKARNEAIELAEKAFPDFDVFFTIDMDEWMAPGWARTIKGRWLKKKHQRISYSHRHFEAEVPASRNWGHAKGWRWKYPCHEVMIRGYDGEIWYDHSEELNLDDLLEVVHYRDAEKPRSSYLPLLEIRWEENKYPEDIAYLIREYMYNQMYEEIISKAEFVESLCVDEGTESCMAWCVLGDAYEHEGNMEKAEWCYERCVALGTKLRRGYMQYARFLIEQKRPEEALVILKMGLDKTEFSQHGIFVDPSDAWTWHYWDWLCVAAYWAGRPVEAVQYALKAYEADKDNKHVKRNVRECMKLLDKELG